VNGDYHKEVLVAAEPGGAPVVNAFDATTSTLVHQYTVFGPTFTGGIYLAAGNVDNQGKDDLIVGPGFTGAPFVNIFEGSTGVRTHQYQIFGTTFTIGVRVAAVDGDGDGDTDVGLFFGLTGQWFLDTNGDPQAERTITKLDGAVGGRAVVGDFDGDGIADCGIFRALTGRWTIDRNHNGVYDPGVDLRYTKVDGAVGGVPLIGKWELP
jgi:hypothetical protein